MNKNYATVYYQNVLHGDTLYNIYVKWKKKKKKGLYRIVIGQDHLQQNGHNFLWPLYFVLYLL
jgi:hypothetical protein